MDDSDEVRNALEDELRATEALFWSEFKRKAHGWQFAAGPIRIVANVGPRTTSIIFIAFNTACFIAGIALMFVSDLAASIGAALIVGALFSFGAFVAQFWVAAFQREHDMIERVFSETRYEGLQQLSAKVALLSQRIDQLRVSGESPMGEDDEQGLSG
jgi:hypothetical protein